MAYVYEGSECPYCGTEGAVIKLGGWNICPACNKRFYVKDESAYDLIKVANAYMSTYNFAEADKSYINLAKEAEKDNDNNTLATAKWGQMMVYFGIVTLHGKDDESEYGIKNHDEGGKFKRDIITRYRPEDCSILNMACYKEILNLDIEKDIKDSLIAQATAYEETYQEIGKRKDKIACWYDIIVIGRDESELGRIKRHLENKYEDISIYVATPYTNDAEIFATMLKSKTAIFVGTAKDFQDDFVAVNYQRWQELINKKEREEKNSNCLYVIDGHQKGVFLPEATKNSEKFSLNNYNEFLSYAYDMVWANELADKKRQDEEDRLIQRIVNKNTEEDKQKEERFAKEMYEMMLNTAHQVVDSELNISQRWCRDFSRNLEVQGKADIRDVEAVSGDFSLKLSQAGTYYIITKYNGGDDEITLPTAYNDMPIYEVGNYAFDGATFVTVRVPQGIRRIGDYAFSNCANLKNVHLSEGLIEIADGAFSNVAVLEEITIPNSVNSIGSAVFQDAVELTTIRLPRRLTDIETELFSGCGKLTTILVDGMKDGDLPSTIINIGDLAFNCCASLTAIHLPDGIKRIGFSAFYKCSQIESIVVPESVEELGMAAFGYCRALKSVKLPNNLKEIVDALFEMDVHLESVNMPEGLERIGERAFYYCSMLDNLTFFDNLKIIDNNAFNSCKSFTNIYLPDSVEVLGKEAFVSCTHLTSIHIPSGIDVISERLFQSCGFSKIVLRDNITRIQEGAFIDCQNIISIELPWSIVEIGKDAFYQCNNVRSITIKGNIEKIADNVFKSCYNLSCLQIPNTFLRDDKDKIARIGINVGKIGKIITVPCSEPTQKREDNIAISDIDREIEDNFDLQFVEGKGYSIHRYNGNTTVLKVPNTYAGQPIFEIGDRAFSGNNLLQEVTISHGISAIGRESFEKCSVLQKVVFEEDNGKNVTSIGWAAFRDCKRLRSMVVRNVGDSNISTGEDVIELPTGLRVIAEKVFYGDESIKKVNIPNGVLLIGDSAFFGCDELSAVQMCNGLRMIGRATFTGSKISCIKLPSTVNNIEDFAFVGMDSLKTAYLPGNITDAERQRIGISDSVTVKSVDSLTLKSVVPIAKAVGKDRSDKKLEEMFDMEATGDGYVVNGIKAGSKSVILPHKYKGLPVVAIGDKAFYNDVTIEQVYIPSSVKKIGDMAFAGCSLLVEVSMAEGVETIGEGAFLQAISLENIKLPTSVEYLGSGAFEGCSNLRNAVLSVNMIAINDNTFSGCRNLESIVNISNIAEIGSCAFFKCRRLEDIGLPNTLNTIGDEAFSMTAVRRLNIPTSVNHIGENALEYTDKLVELALPKSCLNRKKSLGITHNIDIKVNK